MFPFHEQLCEAVFASVRVTTFGSACEKGAVLSPCDTGHLLGLTCKMLSVNPSLQGQIHIVCSEICIFDRADQPQHGKHRDSSF